MYTAPLKDIRFVLEHIAGMDKIAKFPGYDHASPDVIEAVLAEAARVAGEVWAPTNTPGDRQGSKLTDGSVRTPEGFKNAYKQYAEGGWNALTFDQEAGGQGLPAALGMAVNEMWQSANLALSLCPLLTTAAIEAVEKHGTEEQKKLYVEK
jgi:alkylation response protein AidB-like acyl-CoA dehydrogenase